MTMNYERLTGLLQMIVLRVVFLIINHRKQRPQRHHRKQQQQTTVAVVAASEQRQPRRSHHLPRQTSSQLQQLRPLQNNQPHQLHLQQYQSQHHPAVALPSSSRRRNFNRSHALEIRQTQQRSYSSDRYHPKRPVASSRPHRLQHLSEGILVTKFIKSDEMSTWIIWWWNRTWSSSAHLSPHSLSHDPSTQN